MAEKIDLQIGKEAAEQSLDALISKAKQLEESLRKVATALGSNPSQQGAAQLFSTAQQLSSVNSAIGAIQNSATTGGVAAAANAGANAFGRGFVMRTPSDPGAIAATLQGAGVSGYGFGIAAGMLANGPIPQMPGTFNAANYVSQVIGTSAAPNPSGMASAAMMYGGYRLGGGGSGAYFPAGLTAGVAGPFQPPPSYTPSPALSGMYGPSSGATAFIAGSAATGGISSAIEYQTARIRQGGTDLLSAGRSWGTIAGGLIVGGLSALTGNPLITAAGISAGMKVGGDIVERWAAPAQNRLDEMSAMRVLQVESLTGRNTWWSAAQTMRLNRVTNDAESGIAQAWRLPSGGGAMGANAYVGLSESLMQGGINPQGLAPGGHFYGSSGSELATQQSALLSVGSGPARALALRGIFGLGHGNESRGDQLYRRMVGLFHNNIDVGVKQVGDIYASLPETGGNMTDILMRFGAARTNVFNRLGNDDLTSGVSMDTLMSGNASIRGSSRAAEIASLQIRGGGMASAAIRHSALETIAGLPGGKDSQTYASEHRRFVDDLYRGYQQEDITGYGLQSTRLGGREARAALLPFAPANMLGLGVERLSLNRQQIGRLSSRMSSLRQGGNLTEDEEFRLTGQIEGLRTENAGVISRLSEGMEDRLPAMSAGRPAFATRLSSYNLAAMRMYTLGSPVRAFGAANGQHLANQRQFISDMGGSESDVSPRSRFGALNSMGDLSSVLGRLASVLEHMSSNAPNPMRPTELSGSAYAGQQRQNLNQGKIYGASN